MKNTTNIFIDGRAVEVAAGTTVAAAVLMNGSAAFRRSVSGEPRAALCGMGTCHECRVTVDGRAHVRSCRIIVSDGMEIRTADE